MALSAQDLAKSFAARRQKGKTDESAPPSAPVPRQRAETPAAAQWTSKKTKRSPMGKAVDIHHTPPHSVDAEQGVLGSILVSKGAALAEVQKQITHHFFYVPAHVTIYQALCDMWDSGDAIDLITFTQFLRDRNLLDEVGGAAFVTGLFTFVPTAALVLYYIDIVREKFLRREMIRAGSALSRSAYVEGEDLEQLLSNATQTLGRISEGQNLKTLCDAADYLNGQLPPLPKEIIYHILHQGSKMIVGGTSKGRKTMALIDAAVSVATGTPWWGFNTRRGAVCYINFEIQDGFFWYRVEQICKAKGIELERGMFYAWNLRGRAEGIENLLQEILSVIKAFPFVLIIIDPIYKALGARDENRAGDVASMLNEIEKIAVQTGAAVAFGAHYSKGNQAMKESVDRIGGSGVFARDPDTILTMTAHEEEECFTVEGTLRNFPPMRPFVLQWEWPLFVQKDGVDPNKLKKARGTAGQYEKKFPNELLLDQLSIANGLQPKDACKRLKDSHNVSRRTVYNMKEALDEKKLLEVKEGLWYRMPGEIE